eukprot:gene9097-10667_t
MTLWKNIGHLFRMVKKHKVHWLNVIQQTAHFRVISENGNTVTLSGYAFSDPSATTLVYLDDKLVDPNHVVVYPYDSATGVQIIEFTPYTPHHRPLVYVMVGSFRSNSIEISVNGSEVYSMDMSSTSGSNITFRGYNFITNSTLNVTIDGQSSNVTTKNGEFEIAYQCPPGSGANISVSIIVDGLEYLTSYSYHEPVITNVILEYSSTKIVVRIEGTDFGSSCLVSINGVEVVNVTSYHTYTTFDLPTEITSSQNTITLSTGTQVSNTEQFLIQPQIQSVSGLTRSTTSLITIKGQYFMNVIFVTVGGRVCIPVTNVSTSSQYICQINSNDLTVPNQLIMTLVGGSSNSFVVEYGSHDPALGQYINGFMVTYLEDQGKWYIDYLVGEGQQNSVVSSNDSRLIVTKEPQTKRDLSEFIPDSFSNVIVIDNKGRSYDPSLIGIIDFSVNQDNVRSKHPSFYIWVDPTSTITLVGDDFMDKFVPSLQPAGTRMAGPLRDSKMTESTYTFQLMLDVDGFTNNYTLGGYLGSGFFPHIDEQIIKENSNSISLRGSSFIDREISTTRVSVYLDKVLMNPDRVIIHPRDVDNEFQILEFIPFTSSPNPMVYVEVGPYHSNSVKISVRGRDVVCTDMPSTSGSVIAFHGFNFVANSSLNVTVNGDESPNVTPYYGEFEIFYQCPPGSGENIATRVVVDGEEYVVTYSYHEPVITNVILEYASSKIVARVEGTDFGSSCLSLFSCVLIYPESSSNYTLILYDIGPNSFSFPYIGSHTIHSFIQTESSISTSIADVATWTSIVLVDYPSDVAVLKAQRLNGAALFTLTKEELKRPPYNFTGGAASNLILARDKLKISATKLQDHTLASIRSDSKWDHLRNLESLKEKVGSFIELPNIGGVDSCLPKKLSPDKIKSFLLTQERLDLVERFAKMINIGQVNVVNVNPQSGLILSGPNGVGKTFDSYLLACIAYVNNAILFYIPLTQEMASLEDNNKMASYFLTRFIKLNLQASTIQCNYNKWCATTLADLAMIGIIDETQALDVSKSLMAQLKTYTEHPVMYCLDEHQYIWRHGVEKSTFAESFTIETGCSGARTIQVLSGSAHSSFEHNLPSGMSSWKHHVLPFNHESFKTVIGDAESGLLIREDWRGSDKAIDKLAEITGRLPRDIQEMHDQEKQFKTPEDFLNSRKEVYTDEVNKYYHEIKRPIAPSFSKAGPTSISSITQTITEKPCQAKIDGSELQLIADQLTTYFIYVTWSNLEQQRPMFNNIIIIDKNSCKESLNIQ